MKAILLFWVTFISLSNALNLRIVHINDMHARVEGINGLGGCSGAEEESLLCDGGWARLLTAAKQLVSESPDPVIFIDNGDQFTGTQWSTFYKGSATTLLKNKFCEEAGFLLCVTGLGNHEFDYGYSSILKYVNDLQHSVVISNLEDTCEADESALGAAVKKSLVVDVEGTKVGFVGYVLPETIDLSFIVPCLVFENEQVALQREIAALEDEGVDIIFGIGHSGLAREVEISEIFQDSLDLVISGHSHSFLWDEQSQGPIPIQSSSTLNPDGSTLPKTDTVVGPYPTYGENSSVPILQLYLGSRYLGAVDLSFDDSGNLINLEPHALLVASKGASAIGEAGFDPDSVMLEEVQKLLDPFENATNSVVGKGGRDLLDTVDGIRRLEQMEMPLGNLVCDAMLAQAQLNGFGHLCMQNSGGIMGSLKEGEITFGNVLDVLPLGDSIAVLNFTGSRIHQAVEFSLHEIPQSHRAFLQFSKGFQVFYDPLLEPFNRVISISIDGEAILNDESSFYEVVTSGFLAQGGDGVGSIFTDGQLLSINEGGQEDALSRFVAAKDITCASLEDRIVPTRNPLLENGEELDILGITFDECFIKFSILHINDMHARVQGMRGTGGCSTAQNARAECDGGWGRISAASKRFVQERDHPVFFIDNGDEFSGTVWSSFYKGVETATFLNHLCQEETSGGAGFEACFSGIGNHEFDFGYLSLMEFGEQLQHDILTCNIKDECSANSQGGDHLESELGSHFLATKVIEIQGKRIAFVGYTLKETADISSAPNCLVFEDEEEALVREISSLNAQEIDIIIATGHSGIQKDLQIAASIGDIDLIVGGHTHTFLWDEATQGPVPAHSRPVEVDGVVVGLRKEELLPVNTYPRFPANDDTPVVQAYFGSRYLGALDLTFDLDGSLVGFERQSVLLANKDSPVAGATEFNETTGTSNADPSLAFEEDETMMELVNQLLAPLEEFSETPTGEAGIDFDTSLSGGVSVRNSETPLGNLVCDAMLDAFNSNEGGVQVDICFQNGGGIRAPIAKGLVTFGNVIEVHPFGNVLSILEFTGQRVHQALELGLEGVPGSSGAFLNVGTGMEVVYDPRRPQGQQIVSLHLNGEEILNDDSQTYNVVTNSFLADGGDGYGETFTGAPVILATGPPQEDSLVNFLTKFCPSCAEIEGRIVPVVNPNSTDGDEIDILGLEVVSCEEIVAGDCALDETDDEDDDTNTGVTIIVTLVCIVAVFGLFAFIYNLYSNYQDSVKQQTRTSKRSGKENENRTL